MNTTQYIHIDDDDGIQCRHVVDEHRPEGYPVIDLIPAGSPCGLADVVIFPTRGRLERLHQAIGAYLLAHPDPAEETGEYDTRDILGPVSAGPRRCGCGRLMARAGGVWRCLACGASEPPVVAEAATDWASYSITPEEVEVGVRNAPRGGF